MCHCTLLLCGRLPSLFNKPLSLELNVTSKEPSCRMFSQVAAKKTAPETLNGVLRLKIKVLLI